MLGPEIVRLRVPRDNNTWLLHPSASIAQLLHENERVVSTFPHWMLTLRKKARLECMELSRTYLDEVRAGPSQSGVSHSRAERRDAPVDLDDTTLVLGGHQPELFHPGVWFKNILLNRLSTSVNRGLHKKCISLHVVIDHDLARAVSLRVPYVSDGELSQKQLMLPYASDSRLLPWQNTILPSSQESALGEQLDAWDGCLQQMEKDCKGLGIQPLFSSRRMDLLELLRTAPNLGEVFTRLRQRVERDHRLGNDEVPMSFLCDGSSFGEFVYHCIRRHSKLHSLYNRCRDLYRRERHIKNPSQPVPALQVEKSSSEIDAALTPDLRHQESGPTEWFEMPFWMYRDLGDRNQAMETKLAAASFGTRQRMWCRVQGDRFALTTHPKDPESAQAISLVGNLDDRDWERLWQEWTTAGVCIRPRALMTTFFLRYFVADLFVHGIGGGLYDVLTDAIAQEFLGVEPLKMLIASASCHLPFRGDSMRTKLGQDALPDLTSLTARRHRLRSAPETFLDGRSSEHVRLLNKHVEMLQQLPPKGTRKAWYRSMLHLRQEIRQAVQSEQYQQQVLFAEHSDRLNDTRILHSREYSFVLFPEQPLVDQLTILAEEALSSVDSMSKGDGL